MADLVLSHIFGFVQSALWMAILLNIAGARWTFKRLLVTVVMIYMPYGTMVTLLDITMWTIYTWVVLTLFAYRWAFKFSWQMSILFAALTNLIGIIVEYIFILFNSVLPSEWVQGYIHNNFAFRILPTVFAVLLCLLTRNFREKNNPAIEHFAKIHWILYFFAFGILADLTLVHLLEMPERAESLPSISIISLMLVFFLHTLWHLDKTIRNIELEEKLKIEQKYLQSLKSTMDEISGFRHDFANMVRTLKGYLQQNDIAGLAVYVESMDSKVMDAKVIEEMEELTKIPTLYGIIASKIRYAKEHGINFDFCINCENIDLKFFSTLDYSRIMGIFLDNAFEYAEKSKLNEVYFKIRMKSGKLSTSVINPCNSEVDIERIYVRGYSTKEPPSGEGLYQVCQIVAAYERYGDAVQLNTTLKYGMFHQELVLYSMDFQL